MNVGQRVAVGLLVASVLGLSIFSIASHSGLAALGALIGAFLAVWSIGSLSVLVRALAITRPTPAQGSRMTMLVAVLKLPITMLAIYLGTRLAQPGLGSFLAGFGMVYSASTLFLVCKSHG